MFLFIENTIRGGISVVSHRHAKANNPLAPIMTPSPKILSSRITMPTMFMVGAMSERLASSKFSFFSDDDVKSFDLDATTKSDDYRYILEVDLQYPKHLHDTHSVYPFAAETLLVTQYMLSPYSASLIDKHVPSDKLSPNLYDKTKYVLHYENLRFYLKHRILKFWQSAWMKP